MALHKLIFTLDLWLSNKSDDSEYPTRIRVTHPQTRCLHLLQVNIYLYLLVVLITITPTLT